MGHRDAILGWRHCYSSAIQRFMEKTTVTNRDDPYQGTDHVEGEA